VGAKQFSQTNNKQKKKEKIMKKLFFILILALSFVFTSCDAQKEATWYDYGNGVVNLDQVSLIRGNVSFTLVYDNDRIEIIDTSINGNTMEAFNRAIDNAPSGWESVTYQGAIVLDTFTIKLPGFKDRGISLENNDSCKKLVQTWVDDYEKLLSQLDKNQK
jgi:hypothetical protein